MVEHGINIKQETRHIKGEEKDKVLCPKCKNPLQKEVRITEMSQGLFMGSKYFKYVLWYCPTCDFEKEKKIEINRAEAAGIVQKK